MRRNPRCQNMGSCEKQTPVPGIALLKPARWGPCKIKASDQTEIETVFPEGATISTAYIKYFYYNVFNFKKIYCIEGSLFFYFLKLQRFCILRCSRDTHKLLATLFTWQSTPNISLTTLGARSLCLKRGQTPKAEEEAGLSQSYEARWEQLPSALGRMHSFETSQENNLSRDGNMQGSGGRENECAKGVFVSPFISQTAVC